MTPAELVEKALREKLRIRPQESAITLLKAGGPIRLSGGEAEDAARIVLDALAGAGLVVVPAADLIVALANVNLMNQGRDIAAHWHARDELRAAARAVLPEGNADV